MPEQLVAALDLEDNPLHACRRLRFPDQVLAQAEPSVQRLAVAGRK
jgi:hypothetical protein